jgi:spermidine/putrescine transport system substrate-binding protein
MSGERKENRLTRQEFLRYSAGVTAAVAMGGVLASCGSSGSNTPSGGSSSAVSGLKAEKDGDTLALFSWEGYFDENVVKGYEKQYGIKVIQTYVTSSDDQLQKVAAGLPFDIVTSNSSSIAQLVQANKLLAIDHSQLANWGQVTPFFANPPFDPGAKYCAPYCYAPAGLAYQEDKISTSALTGSWTDLWTWAPKVKGVYMLNDQRMTLGAGLMHLGYSQNSVSSDELNKAADAVIALKPSLAGFASTNTIQLLESGQASMIISYTGNVYTALNTTKTRKQLIKYENCKEGSFFNSDLLSIASTAKHPGNAMLWIDWNLAADNMTKNVNWTGYPVGTTAADTAYKALTKDYPFLQIDPDLLQNPDAWTKSFTPEEQKVWNEAWVKVQAA